MKNTHALVIASDLFSLGGEGLHPPLGHAELVEGDLQLSLQLVVVGLDLGELERLLLDGLLQVDVGLVGGVQRHLQFGDLDLEFLLDASDLGLEPGLGLDDAGVELLDFDRRGFTGMEILRMKIRGNMVSEVKV